MLSRPRKASVPAAPTPEHLIITTATALIYLRISANRTSEHASIEQQRADCTALADHLGYARTIEFVDEAVSAYHDRARPAYQQLIRQLEASEAETIVVWHLDRLYRKPRELEQLLDLLDVRPIRVESVQGGSFDLNRHEGRLFARQLVAFANYESAPKGARVAGAQQQRARRWLLHSGRHYGYLQSGALHPRESKVLRRMVDEYPIGISPTVIAQCLDVDRIQPPRRDRWHATTVRAIFNSERLHIKRWDHVGQPQIIGSWERLLTQDESALVQVGLLMPRRDAARSSRTLLGGILRCHRCGARLVAGVTRHGKRIYTCRTATKRCPGPSVAADDLDAETEAAALDTFVNALHFDVPCAQDLLGRVRIARIKLAALAASFGAGDVDHTSFLRRRGPLVEQLDRAGHDVATHTRARILALGTTEFHRHWTRLAFRRAAVCALVSFDTPTTSPFTPGPRDPRTLKR